MGYSPWGHKELDMTEHARMHTHNHFEAKKKQGLKGDKDYERASADALKRQRVFSWV